MIRVAICEADKKSRGMIREAWEDRVPETEGLEMTVYETGRALLESVRDERFSHDILMIDSHLPDIDGFVIMEFLRRVRIPVTIVLISRENESARRGYRYFVYDFIRKPLQREDVNRVADRYISQFILSKANIKKVYIHGREKILHLEDVMYFESHVRVINAVTARDETGFYMKMNDLADELAAKGFFRSHQSFLVNLTYVNKLENSSLILYDRTKIPVSRRYIRELKMILEEKREEIGFPEYSSPRKK